MLCCGISSIHYTSFLLVLAGVGVLTFTPILAVLLGVVVSLILMALVIALVVRSRRPRDNRKQEVKMVYDKGASGSTTSPLRGATAADDEELSSTAGATATEDPNPDVIPVNDGKPGGGEEAQGEKVMDKRRKGKV